MSTLLLEILAIWGVAALVAAFGLGAAIRKGEQARKDEFLSSVFASVEALQSFRG